MIHEVLSKQIPAHLIAPRFPTEAEDEEARPSERRHRTWAKDVNGVEFEHGPVRRDAGLGTAKAFDSEPTGDRGRYPAVKSNGLLARARQEANDFSPERMEAQMSEPPPNASEPLLALLKHATETRRISNRWRALDAVVLAKQEIETAKVQALYARRLSGERLVAA
jgi:hypothetical protein